MVQEFNTLDELWLNAAWLVYNKGHSTESRDGPCTEYLGFVARLNNPAANFMFNPVRKMSPSYAAAEVIWYLSGEDDIDRILPYAPQYERFANNGVAHGAYGKRWRDGCSAFRHGKAITTVNHKSQLEALLALLRVKQQSRHAVLTCWNSGDLLHSIVGDKNDLPCTIALNFNVRDNKLYLTTTMRSNDIWLGLPYDIFAFTCLQMLVASELNLELGWYQHQAMSLHVYGRNDEKCRKASTPDQFNTFPLEYNHNTSFMDRIRDLCYHEAHQRENKTVRRDITIGGPGTLMTQLSCMAATKWNWERAIQYITNPCLVKYVKWLKGQ